MKLAPILRTALLATLAFASSGCGIGYNRVLFFTRTNAGIDFDSSPPTAEISIARREGVIEPSFEGGQTLPVMASFTSTGNGASRLLSGGVGMTFSTGAAAVAMSKHFDDTSVKPTTTEADLVTTEAQVTVTKLPEPVVGNWLERGFYWVTGSAPRTPYEQGEMVPLVFGTESALGLKALVSGQTSGPTLQFGFRRKETAITPVSIGKDRAPAGSATKQLDVSMPSLIATLDADFQAKAEELNVETKLQYVQYFATGRAATNLALQPAVRNTVLPRILPDLTAAARAKQSEVIADARGKGDAAWPKAVGELDRLTTPAQLEKARQAAVDVGYLAAGDPFPSTKQRDGVRVFTDDVDGKRAYLKALCAPDDTDESVRTTERFAELLKLIE